MCAPGNGRDRRPNHGGQAFVGQWLNRDGALIQIRDTSVLWPDGSEVELGVQPEDGSILELMIGGKAACGEVTEGGAQLRWGNGDVWLRFQDYCDSYYGFGREQEAESWSSASASTCATKRDHLLQFPDGFLWGSATSAFQVEGATAEGGRSPSIWDTFCATPNKVSNGDAGHEACDHYHRWREDVQLLHSLGFGAYRFSISWPRLLPRGRGAPNPEAVEFYGALLDELRAHGVKPVVTLYHWDLPQCLEDEYGGWLSRKVIEDFEHFASVCFAAFGDRVEMWLTLNEPWCSAVLGYGSGEHAPGRCGAPGTEPYLAGHHMLLAHARAVARYRGAFQALQGGQIGLTLNTYWKEPLTASAADRAARNRSLDWNLGWFADPIWKGDYPSSMRERLGRRLPAFTAQEKELVFRSSDFFGLNHYSTDYVSANLEQQDDPHNYFDDSGTHGSSDPRSAQTAMGWAVVPWGLKHLCEYVQQEYAPPGGIIIMENGCAAEEGSSSAALHDGFRVEYLAGYIAQLHKAIQNGADVRGYFVWSFLDNFEWQHGYSKRFGIVRVDYKTQMRLVKASGKLMSEVARTNTLRISGEALEASDFIPIMDDGASGGPKKSQPATQRSGGAKAKEGVEGILLRLRSLHADVAALQAEGARLSAADAPLASRLVDEAKAFLQAAQEMTPVRRGTMTVYDDTDAFAKDNVYAHKVDGVPSVEERVALGVDLCGYLDCGGFCIYEDSLYFRKQAPEMIERFRMPSRGCTLVVVRRSRRPRSEFSAVPMGHCLAVKGFLRQTGWRAGRMPLDTSILSFQVWRHMLKDDFVTLLCDRRGRREHPYNSMFRDVKMFVKERGWATAGVKRRVSRLRSLLAEHRAFGLAFYVEGYVGCSLEQVAHEAQHLVRNSGFKHIAVVWLEEQREGAPPTSHWWEVGAQVDVLQYSLSAPISCHCALLPPEDTVQISGLLEDRFPQVFTHGFTEAASGGPRADGSSSSDGSAGEEEEEEARWSVTGGGDRGGIVARADADLQSPILGRLETGSEVAELELVGDRLHYRLLRGGGPSEGWAFVRLHGKELMRRVGR